MKLKTISNEVLGYPTTIKGEVKELFDSTTDEYAQTQMECNDGKVRRYIVPFLEKTHSKTVLDAGCGVGAMVQSLESCGYDAYGVDLITLAKYWHDHGMDKDHFFVVDPYDFELPFQDNSLDFAFSLGVIEHIGTSNGHSDRLDNYHEFRKNWLREIYRVLKPGGHMLIGGPNRNFPIDTAHGLDSKASNLEKKLSALVGSSVHKTWGELFLWGYSDFPRYLEGLPYELQAQRVTGLVEYSRVPAPFRKLTQLYVDHTPQALLETGLNPWVMALIKKLN